MDQHMVETTNLSINYKSKVTRKTLVSLRAHIDNRNCQHCGLFVYVSKMMTDNLDELKVIYFRGRHTKVIPHGIRPYHNVFSYSLFLFYTVLSRTVQAWIIKTKKLI